MAEFSLGEVLLGTGIDLAGLFEGFAKAKEESEKAGGGIADTLAGALKVGMIAAGVAVAAAVAGIGVAAFDTASQVSQASNDIQAELGVTKSEADELGQAALRVWGQNWGDSIDDVKNGIVTVRQQMKGLADEELEGVTAKAFAIRDAFGIDVAESTNAANVLMQKFGLTSDQAFDFISSGFQRGLNNSGDFLESVTEYGVQFSDAGFQADEFFSVLQSGQQGFSSLGTDKAADAIKEFRIRIMELGDDVFGPEGSLRSYMSGDAINELFNGLQDGSVTAADAFTTLMPILQGIDNDVHRNTLGVQLFGTQWEDLGPSAALALDPTTTSLADMAGATDSLNAKYNNWPAMWEGIKRSALVAIEPLGEKLLSLANDAMPIVQAGFDWLQNDLPPIIAVASAAIDTGVKLITDLFNGPLADSLGSNEQFFTDTFATVGAIVTDTAVLVTAILGVLAGFIVAHGTEIKLVLSGAWQLIQGVIQAALALISGIIKTALALIRGDWEGAWEAIVTMSRGFVTGLGTAILGGLNIIAGFFGTSMGGILRTWQGNWDLLVQIVQKLPSVVSSTGAAIVQAIWDGMRAKWQELVDWFNDKLQQLKDQLPFSEPKDHTSPLYGLGESGESIMDMVRSGMDAAPPLQLAPMDMPQMGQFRTLGASTAGVNVTITIADRGVSWLKDLIRTEATAVMDAAGQRALNRSRTGN